MEYILRDGMAWTMSRPYFAFLIGKFSTRAEDDHVIVIAKGRITVLFSDSFDLINLHA